MKINTLNSILLCLFVVVVCPAVLRADNIQMIKQGGVYQLPVEMNGVITLHFILDTGAADVNIPADVARTLYRAGTIRDTDFLPGRAYTLADGSTLNSARFLLRSLQIGRRRVTNVAASIGPVSSPLLLGQSFLEELGAWGIDNQRHVLTLDTPGQRQESTSPSPPGGPQVAVGVYPSLAAPKTMQNSIGMEFVRIEAGTYQMGSNDGDSDEKPVHTVRISRPFFLGQYEVTQAQWEAVMANNPSRFKGDPERPVENVSWEDVQEFILKLNDKERGATYRLPTEAEWEYAARAGSTTDYSFGNDMSQLGEYAWSWENSENKTHPVGHKRPNVWGLYDMLGNVWEWVQDWHGRYPAAPVTDPQGPLSGSGRVMRSVSWDYGAKDHRLANRGRVTPGERNHHLGFRLLREVP